MVKYSLRPREILRAKPKGFPGGSDYILPYIPTRITIQTFSITKLVLSFQKADTQTRIILNSEQVIVI